MRKFLVTKFVCSECGSNLTLRYNDSKYSGSFIPGEPTGASMVEQIVVIHPCRCMTTQLDKIRKAVKTLLDE